MIDKKRKITNENQILLADARILNSRYSYSDSDIAKRNSKEVENKLLQFTGKTSHNLLQIFLH